MILLGASPVQTASNIGLICGFFGSSLAVGILLGVRVYGPPPATVRLFHAVSKVAALVGAGGGAVFLFCFLATGNGPG